MKTPGIFAALLCLYGCANAPVDSQIERVPAQFANADFQLSYQDAQRWVNASQRAKNCIYPNLTRIQQQHFSAQDQYLYSQYVLFYPLEKIIGESYLKIMQEDEKSMGYAIYQYKKASLTSANIEPMASAQCEILRQQARDDLAVLNGEYKNGMTEEKSNKNKEKEDNKEDKDGIATNQNKFFFDIIKWGAALLF